MIASLRFIKMLPFLNVLTFSHGHNNWGFCYIRGSNCILLCPPEVVHLFKRKTISGIQRSNRSLWGAGGGGQDSVLRTLLKKGAGSCEACYLSSRKFEGLVINKIKEHILTGESLQKLVRLVNEETDSTAGNYREDLGVISDETAGINGRLERLYDALETGKLGFGDSVPRIQQLRHQQEQLQSRKWELEALLSDRRVELADLEIMTRCVADLYYATPT